MNKSEKILQKALKLQQSGNFLQAEEIYMSVLKENEENPDAWNNMGLLYYETGRPKEAIDFFNRAVSIQPDFIRAYRNKADVLYWNGSYDDALECYERIISIDPSDAYGHTYKGIIHLLRGSFRTGWQEYRWRWKLESMKLPPCSKPEWNGENLDNRTILLYAEQGLGDTVLFARYASILKSIYKCTTVVACSRSLLCLLKNCLGIDRLISHDEKELNCDYFCSFQDVPAVLGEDIKSTPGTVPYLSADRNLSDYWKKRIDKYEGFKIGIAWQGNPEFHGDLLRSFPLLSMEPLMHLHNTQLISLQKGPGSDQIENGILKPEITDLGKDLDNNGCSFIDTSAVLDNIDLLISPDTAVAHIAGAMGVPVWNVLGTVPFWVWQIEGERTPWYPSMKLFRRKASQEWEDVFREIAGRLMNDNKQIRLKEPHEYRLAEDGINILLRTRHGLMWTNRFDTVVGRSLMLYGEYSEDECHIFRQVLHKGSTVVEAGANIGPHTLVFSEIVGDEGSVYAYEPQKTLFETLCNNLALNNRKNAICFSEALGSKEGMLYLPCLDYSQDNNFGGVELQEVPTGTPVKTSTIDSLKLSSCTLIKADVEGMELEVLKGAERTIKEHKPFLYVENDRRSRAPALIAYLQSLGYDLYWHLPFLYSPDNYFRNKENVFPGIISANMICIHRSSDAKITGFAPVSAPESFWQD